ncbi:MAG: hypothetical protein M3511_12465, partial [Deinococcota bacterium]|nr:hypothetical protein [Deinococcota bacterium]
LDEAVEAGVTYYYVVTAVDAEGNESAASNEASASLTQGPGPACLPRSTLSCDQVPVSLPFSLTWSSNEGGLVDTNGIGTGLTMVDPPSNRLDVDAPISNPDILGYEPRNLLVNTGAGTLNITTNKGIQFRDVNALVNALGVGFDASAQAHTITTTVVNPVFPAANQFQQAGLWFGPNEDNYIKLVLVNAAGGGMATVQMVREVNGISIPPADEVNLPAFTLEPGSTVRLIMSTNPANGTVSGAYQIGEGEVVELPANFTAPPTFFVGIPLAEGVGPVGFAGIFATHRNADTPLNFSFGEFGIE